MAEQNYFFGVGLSRVYEYIKKIIYRKRHSNHPGEHFLLKILKEGLKVSI